MGLQDCPAEQLSMSEAADNPVDAGGSLRHGRFKALKWGVGIGGLLVGAFIGYRYLLLDRDPLTQPICHKQVDSSLHAWCDNNNTKSYPNVRGDSAESLAVLNNYMPHFQLSKKYMYVPGLRSDDPGDLVLMYLRRPTRWQWHAEPRTIFREKEWIVVARDFSLYGRDETRDGELNERMTLAELKSRLRRTLDYLRKHNRPHWRAVAMEHRRFLAEASE